MGQSVFLSDFGYFTIISKPSDQLMLLEYQDIAANTHAGDSMPIGTEVSPGSTAVDGENGINALATLTAALVVPAINANVLADVTTSAWMTVGQYVYLQGAGIFTVVSKPSTEQVTLRYEDFTTNTQVGTNIPINSQISPSGPEPTYASDPLLSGNDLSDLNDVQTALGNLGLNKVPLSVYAAGTAYQLTATQALLNFGTTDPSLTLDAAGTYVIFARARIDYNAATFADEETVTLKLRRTNNTAADLTNSSTSFLTAIITTLSHTAAIIDLPPVVYVTDNSDDIVQLWGACVDLPGAGSIDATEASIVALRIFNQTL